MKKGLGDSQPDDPEPSGLRGSRDDVGKEVFDDGFELIAICAILGERQGVDSCAQISVRVCLDVVIGASEVPAKVEKDGSIRLGDLAGVDELVDIRHVSHVVEAETRIHAIVREGQRDLRAHLDHGVLDVILRGFQGFQGFEGTGVEDLVSFVVADAVKLNIRGLSLDYYEQYILRDLEESFGITPMRLFGGGWELKLGFDGYGSRRTKKYPRGLPNQLAARAIESGTSFRPKQPFVRPAVNAARNPCREAMKRQIDEDIQKIMK